MKITNIKISVLIIFMFSLFISSCDSNDVGLEKDMNSNLEKKYIELTQDEVVLFLSKLNTVRLNDRWTDIKKQLGDPDIEKALTSKETSEMRGKVRRYYIRKESKELVNEDKDVYVSLFFSENDTLKEIEYHNIDSN